MLFFFLQFQSHWALVIILRLFCYSSQTCIYIVERMERNISPQKHLSVLRDPSWPRWTETSLHMAIRSKPTVWWTWLERPCKSMIVWLAGSKWQGLCMYIPSSESTQVQKQKCIIDPFLGTWLLLHLFPAFPYLTSGGQWKEPAEDLGHAICTPGHYLWR